MANDACDNTLRSDKYLLGGDFDTHYTRSRTEFAVCTEEAHANFVMCQNYKRCDVRLMEAKAICDEIFLKAAKAKQESVRVNFETMD